MRPKDLEFGLLGERLGRRAALGLGLLCAGTLGMLAA